MDYSFHKFVNFGYGISSKILKVLDKVKMKTPFILAKSNSRFITTKF